MAKLYGVQQTRRGKELEPIRKAAFEAWLQDKTITGSVLKKQLDVVGSVVAASTVFGWIKRWRSGKGLARGLPATATVEPHFIRHLLLPKPRTSSSPTLDDIIKAAGDLETLSVLTFQGMMKKMEEKNTAYETIRQENLRLQQRETDLKNDLNSCAREKNKVMREYNELLAKRRVGTLSINTVTHRLESKER